ncbi:MAG: hypothetical protein GY910_15225 [bacterium]|nr:hypothetical protein [Deltaproteobacteria bacterium]MCP4906327.1 hypothetical protein [bacterium]
MIVYVLWMLGWLQTLARRDEDKGALGRHGLLLGSLVALLVALPLVQTISGSTPRFSILLTLVLVAAVLVNSHQRWIFVVASLTGLGAVIGIAGAEFSGSSSLRLAAHLLSLGLLGFTTLVLLNSLIQANEVSRDTIVGGICVYLLVGLCFGMAFLAIADLQPGAFVSQSEALVPSLADTSALATQLLYFSFVTLTTLGYGDITPVHDMAQMLAVAEAIVGQLYLTIFVARLVALYVGRASKT